MTDQDGSAAASGAGGGLPLHELLRDRAFALYLVGQTTSGAGGALSSVALVFAVLSVAHSPEAVGLVLLAGRLPAIAITLAGGVLADRRSRRSLALGANAVRALLQTATGVLLLTGHASLVTLAVAQLGSGACRAVFGPAAAALAAGVAPGGELRRAASLEATCTAAAQTGGLAVAGVVVALAGPGTSLIADGATFAVSAVTLGLLPSRGVTTATRSAPVRDLAAGWHAVRARGWLTAVMAHETLVDVLALAPFFVLGPVIAARRLGGAPAWSAIALGYVAGTLVAAQLTYRWAPRRPILVAVASSAALAPLLGLLAIAGPIWALAPAAVVAGAQGTLYNTLTASAVQANLPDALLARATALAGLGTTTLAPVSMGLAGVVAGAVGSRPVLAAGGLLALLAAPAFSCLPAVRAPLALDRRPRAPH